MPLVTLRKGARTIQVSDEMQTGGPRRIAKHLRDGWNLQLKDDTGQTVKKIEKDTDRNFFMSSQEAKAYGIIDEVLVREVKKRKKKGGK